MINKYRTIDLFAGIGGIRLGFEQTGRVLNVFSAEIDKYACKTYEENFGDNPYCDVTKINPQDIPNFDILLAGFPCQAFSIAGKRGGFNDTRGTLFFDVARIIKEKRPQAFLLENVKGLTNHDRGRTFETILNVLDELNYKTYWKIINSKDFGVPQNRERIYIIGFDKEKFEEEKINFTFPKPIKECKKIKDILEKEEVSNKYYLSQKYLDTLKAHKERHKNKGNGFGFEILDPEGIANAIVVGGMGRERNLIIDKKLTDFTPKTNKEGGINKDFVRTLTPREWARLQGFPEDFKIPVSDTQAYKQFGNSVTVPVIYNIAKEMIKTLDSLRSEGKREKREKHEEVLM
jgi:DNA (cytosine-5)-methyltransferase 1